MKDHAVLKDDCGALDFATLCGRATDPRHATTLRLNDLDRLDWCSYPVQDFINDPRSCRACIRAVRRMAP